MYEIKERKVRDMTDQNLAEEIEKNLEEEPVNEENVENAECELSETDIEGVEGGAIALAGMYTY